MTTASVAAITPEMHAARWAGFCEGIQYVLKGWTALQIAIDAQMAGRYTSQTSAELFNHMAAFFQQYGTEVMPHEIAQNLEAYFDEVFNANLDDGSPTQIGQQLCRLYKEVVLEGCADTFNLVKATASKAAGAAGASARQGDSSSDDEDSDGEEDNEEGSQNAQGGAQPMAVDPPPTEQPARQQRRPDPIIDEDGFETVQKKGRRRN